MDDLLLACPSSLPGGQSGKDILRHTTHHTTRRDLRMDRRGPWQALIASLILAILLLQLLILVRLPTRSEDTDIHTVVLGWPPREVRAFSNDSGYVVSWEPQVDIKIVAVQVWMGNPLGILWEGDVYVTLNNQSDFQSPDQVIVHYQFDKHAESSVPHQRWFQVGCERTGFRVRAGQTIWIWFAFNNISDKEAKSGDGQVIIYYMAG